MEEKLKNVLREKRDKGQRGCQVSNQADLCRNWLAGLTVMGGKGNKGRIFSRALLLQLKCT